MGRDARGLQEHLNAEFMVDEGHITNSLRALCIKAKQRDAVLVYFIEMALHHSMMVDAKERYFRDDALAGSMECPPDIATEQHSDRRRVRREVPPLAVGTRRG